MWYLYIIKCKDKTLYTGITNDLSKRIECHNQGKASKYTRGRTPVKLVYHESHADKSSALKREREIKSWPRSKKQPLI